MRTRALVLMATLLLPGAVSAQILRLPRTVREPTTEPVPLPPEIAPVTRGLAYTRSRWSAEAYSLLSSVQVPIAGHTASYTSFGTGTRANYRYSDHFSATIDLTASAVGSPLINETAEVGSRYSPLPYSEKLRPFFDLRASYMNLYDSFVLPSETGGAFGSSTQDFAQESRYSRGLGSVGGAGLEYSLTNSWAITTEVSAMRSRMTTYRLSDPTSVPVGGTNYWMTSYRLALGFKYNPLRTLQLKQNPAQ